MKLTQYSDLGLRLLMYLAMHEGELATIGEVSERFAVSKNHLVKVAHQLATAGLIESMQGRGGGIRLARPARDITVEEALRTTEDGFDLVECFDEQRDQCVISGTCRLTAVLGRARAAFFEVLREVTLADLVTNRRTLERALRPSASSREVQA